MLSSPLVSDRCRREKQHLELSNLLSSQALDLFRFTADKRQTHSLYLWPIENAHSLYSGMASTELTMPTDTSIARALYSVKLFSRCRDFRADNESQTKPIALPGMHMHAA